MMILCMEKSVQPLSVLPYAWDTEWESRVERSGVKVEVDIAHSSSIRES